MNQTITPSWCPAIRNYSELLRHNTEVVASLADAQHLHAGDTFFCHREGVPSETCEVVATLVEPQTHGRTLVFIKRCDQQRNPALP